MTYILVKPDPPEGNTTRIATFMCEFQLNTGSHYLTVCQQVCKSFSQIKGEQMPAPITGKYFQPKPRHQGI